MRIVYMGTPEFALAPLKALKEAGHEIVGVFSQPDRPKGRGMKMIPTPVKQLAQEMGISVYQPETFRDHAALPILEELKPDIIVVVAYGKMLPPYVLKFAKYGCINIHGSLLPKYRGAAPMQRAVMNGDAETGITIMHLVREMDAGDIIISESTPIGEYETYGEVGDRLSVMGAGLVVKAIELLENGTAPRIKQDIEQVTYAEMITHDDMHINWNQPARNVCNIVRGLLPAPGAFAVNNGQNFKMAGIKVYELESDAEPGTVLGMTNDGRMLVKCLDSAAAVEQIQAPGSRMMKVADYARGHALPERFE